jgi:phage terminase large subunit GpA-like protein
MECAEGDPLKLAERRTLTYRNRKLVCGSSPKDDATSLISKLYAESDQRVFEIACPHCDRRNRSGEPTPAVRRKGEIVMKYQCEKIKWRSRQDSNLQPPA